MTKTYDLGEFGDGWEISSHRQILEDSGSKFEFKEVVFARPKQQSDSSSEVDKFLAINWPSESIGMNINVVDLQEFARVIIIDALKQMKEQK